MNLIEQVEKNSASASERWVYAFALLSSALAMAQSRAFEPRWGALSSLGLIWAIWAVRGLLGRAR
jgi:hypothetical protein